MNFEERENGYAFSTDYAFAFFSFGHLNWNELQNFFPEYQFDRAKQVHGDRLIESVPNESGEANVIPEADALFTRHPRRAVTVLTADCLPILIMNPDVVFAIHAGWRGIKNEIILNSLQSFGTEFCSHPLTLALIGPHIRHESFEVDKVLAEEFKDQQQVYHIAHGEIEGEPPAVLPHPTRPDEKAYVNLHTIAMHQLLLAGFRKSRIHSLPMDTRLDTRFASYRRDKDRAGRNFSFVCRL